MVKRKRSSSRKYLTVADRIETLTQTVSENHLATVERLARMEEQIKGLPARVDSLEKKSNILSGAMITISTLFTAAATIFGIRQH